MQHPQERKQTEQRRRARDKQKKTSAGRDEVKEASLCHVKKQCSEQVVKVNEGQSVTLKTDLTNRLWGGEGVK